MLVATWLTDGNEGYSDVTVTTRTLTFMPTMGECTLRGAWSAYPLRTVGILIGLLLAQPRRRLCTHQQILGQYYGNPVPRWSNHNVRIPLPG